MSPSIRGNFSASPLVKGDEVEEVEDPPIPSSQGDTAHLAALPNLATDTVEASLARRSPAQ